MGDKKVLKPALRLMTWCPLVIEGIKDSDVVTSYTAARAQNAAAALAKVLWRYTTRSVRQINDYEGFLRHRKHIDENPIKVGIAREPDEARSRIVPCCLG